ncbi:MAG: hypothetical protein IK105_06260 [Thermoguttaceae bacterium]|nr:hypothetical protein [Thermoguttaceae bacterium]
MKDTDVTTPETAKDTKVIINEALQMYRNAKDLCKTTQPENLDAEAKMMYFSLLYSANDLLMKLSDNHHSGFDEHAFEICEINEMLATCYDSGIGTTPDHTKSMLHKSLGHIYFEKELEYFRKESRKRKIRNLPWTIFSWIFITCLAIVALVSLFYYGMIGYYCLKKTYWPDVLPALCGYGFCFWGGVKIITFFVSAWVEDYENPYELISGMLIEGTHNISQIYKIQIKSNQRLYKKIIGAGLLFRECVCVIIITLLSVSVIPLAIYFLFVITTMFLR